MSFLSDNHFAQIEGIKEESILLLRNFYKVSKQNNPHQVSHNMCVLTLENLKNYTICTQITSTQISRAIAINRTDIFKFQSGMKRLNQWDRSLISCWDILLLILCTQSLKQRVHQFGVTNILNIKNCLSFAPAF